MTASSSSSPNGQSTSLSIGVKTGISVGIALCASAGIGAIAFFLLKRRRKQRWRTAPAQGPGGNLAYDQAIKYEHMHWQPAVIYEAGDTSRPVEVQGDNYRREEMPGSENNLHRTELPSI